MNTALYIKGNIWLELAPDLVDHPQKWVKVMSLKTSSPVYGKLNPSCVFIGVVI
jgi:hypothetical protein